MQSGGRSRSEPRLLPSALLLAALALGSGAACSGDGGSVAESTAESCMSCHNGSNHDDYEGAGLENPHPFPGADALKCTTCHGGNGKGRDRLASHVPPPPQIGDREYQDHNAKAYFNRLTLAGIDKLPDYIAGGQTYSAIDYLQFINPGDLRVVTQGRSCGQCHQAHAECVADSLLATEAGIFSGARYTIGADNAVPSNQGLYEDTAADLGFRAAQDDSFVFDPDVVGPVSELVEFPVFSVHGASGPMDLFDNQAYSSADLPNDLDPDNSVKTGSRLAALFHEQVAFTCGDCHLGSAGANNRYGDFRSSGCTACHMQYSLSGRAGSRDPHVDRLEPADPDDIDDPEQPHVRQHLIRSTARRLPGGKVVAGIDDYACAGCHQGSNRTVMQYWGIRLDQNDDVHDHDQYPANPVSFVTTALDTRLFDPQVGNHTFNGRRHEQYLLEEDYDGDGRDDTPPDVHYEAGLGCIDCHGSYDLHGGDVTAPDHAIMSHMEQAVAIRCESCHGGIESYAPTTMATTYDGEPAEVAVDAEGIPLRHVVKEADGHYYLYSRLTGKRHYVPQTMDTVVDNGRQNPLTEVDVYTDRASYAMGRKDGNPSTGIGPQQRNGSLNGFAHGDSMSCVSCHASWTNTCIGCHLEGEYDTGNNFSNITGDRIVFEEAVADFVYQTPLHFQLGVDSRNQISPIAPNTDAFFRYEDINNQKSQVFAFTDRNGGGNNPVHAFPSMSHNAMMPHSIRGRVDSQNEGPRYCVSCHLTQDGITAFGTQYGAFRSAIENGNWGAINYQLLKDHFGKNPGNQLDSPLFVHMVAGLGSGLYLFDEQGCAVNPLDQNDDRAGCNGQSPADTFDPARVHFDLDRIVDENGVSQGSNAHPMAAPGQGPNLRQGAANPNMAGPLGADLIRRLTDVAAPDVIVLNSWLDANRDVKGHAGDYVDD